MQEPEIDAELLDMQRRKSRPRVVVEEYLKDSESSDDDALMQESTPSPIKIEEKKVSEVSFGSAGAQGQGTKLVKVKTHMDIDDFGDLTEDNAKQIGMKEVSPLDRKIDELEKKQSLTDEKSG